MNRFAFLKRNKPKPLPQMTERQLAQLYNHEEDFEKATYAYEYARGRWDEILEHPFDRFDIITPNKDNYKHTYNHDGVVAECPRSLLEKCAECDIAKAATNKDKAKEVLDDYKKHVRYLK